MISYCIFPHKSSQADLMCGGNDNWGSFRINSLLRTSLVVQWIRICLPIQGHEFDPWSRKIPHGWEQLSSQAQITEPTCCAQLRKPEHPTASKSQLPSPGSYSLCSTREGTAMRSPSSTSGGEPLLATTRESARAATKTQRKQNLNE